MKTIDIESEKVDSGKKIIPQLSVDAKLIADRLEKVAVGELIEYDPIGAIIKADVQNGARGTLQSARRYLQREKHIVFEAVIGKGLKRLNDAEIVSTGIHTLARIRRTARRGASKLRCANYDTLAPEDQTRFNATASMLGAIHHVAKDKNLKLLEAEAAKTKAQISFNSTIELFKK